MTAALDLLVKTRRLKTEEEVEEDFKNHQESKMLEGPNYNAKKKS